MRERLLPFVEQLKSDGRIASFDEAATKQTVLLRILSLLGWDTYNIDEVIPEYSVSTQRVDYALRHSNVNKAFIEVKKVGEDLEKHQEQLLNYSFNSSLLRPAFLAHIAILSRSMPRHKIHKLEQRRTMGGTLKGSCAHKQHEIFL